MVWFQEPGVAEVALERDVLRTLRTTEVWTADWASRDDDPRPPRPEFWTEDDEELYVCAFSRTGFTGGLNWYRNIDRNWELTTPWQDAPITPPALFLTGEDDLVRQFTDASHLPRLATDLRGVVHVPDSGHWVQLERPAEVNSALLEFFAGL
jgi:pimeloyl-ACP methyl ester carboxylesterase